MNHLNAAAALRALAESSQDRSQTARLLILIDDVEAALAAGVRRSVIVETLATHGLHMTPKSFETALYRIRKRRSRNAPKPTATSKPTASVEQDATGPAPDSPFKDLDGLDPKERRERLADKFINPSPSNPFLQRLIKEQKP